MMATVDGPNERASIAASAEASADGASSSPAASSPRSSGERSASDGLEGTGGGLGRLRANLGEGCGHARVQIIDEGIDRALVGRGKRPANFDVDAAVGEGVHGFLDCAGVPELV